MSTCPASRDDPARAYLDFPFMTCKRRHFCCLRQNAQRAPPERQRTPTPPGFAVSALSSSQAALLRDTHRTQHPGSRKRRSALTLSCSELSACDACDACHRATTMRAHSIARSPHSTLRALPSLPDSHDPAHGMIPSCLVPRLMPRRPPATCDLTSWTHRTPATTGRPDDLTT